jgi:hypothetical protein
MQHPQPSIKIKWLDSVRSYSYTYTGRETISAEIISIRDIEKPARSKAVFRHTFHCEAEAILCLRRKRHQENLEHLENILPELAKFEWLHMPIHEIKAAESEMIDELDSLRQIDMNTGHIIYSYEYRALEKQLALLLEACECLSKKEYVESLINPMQQHDIREHDGTEQNWNYSKKRSCLSSFLIPFSKCTFANKLDDFC